MTQTQLTYEQLKAAVSDCTSLRRSLLREMNQVVIFNKCTVKIDLN